MSGASRSEYLAAIKQRYRKATRAEKQAMLDELEQALGPREP